nr:37s ribosomal protein mrp51, mitochondrial [Quercus suber]
MSKAVNSPTARLLQSSRLFSLPRSLPQPGLEGGMSSSGLFRASDSATSTYPTHQAITTPPSSHYRGDWGLKRPLPGKATRGTSTPHIRVQAQDTPEHITDFTSAADHTATVLKWQESGIPMVVKPDRHRSRISEKPKPVSVYEESTDSTEGDAATRWKFTGPFIAGMGEGEFERYLKTAVQSQRDAWQGLLRKTLAEDRLRKLVLREEGTGRSFWKRADVQKKFLRQYVNRISDEHLNVYQKQLRDDHAADQLSSQLTALISAFLDLPAVLVEKESRLSAQNAIFRNLGMGISETAPPSTHPGAGISHLRTNAIMSNHPLHGPQLYREPVLARVLKPRNHATNNETNAKLGVAGVVAQDPVSGNFQTNNRFNSGPDDPEVMANAMDPDLAGGNKIWVHPQSAWVDERGRLRMEVIRGDREAIAVKTDNVQHIHEARRSASTGNTMTLGSIGGTQRQSQMMYGGQPGNAQRANRSRTSPNRTQAQPDLVGALKGAATQRQPAPRYPGLRSNVSGFDAEVQS